MLLSLATSIDALATGIILPSAVQASTVALMLLAAALIGLITFIICIAGVYIGKNSAFFFRKSANCRRDCAILIGLKIFIEHMFLQ